MPDGSEAERGERALEAPGTRENDPHAPGPWGLRVQRGGREPGQRTWSQEGVTSALLAVTAGCKGAAVPLASPKVCVSDSTCQISEGGKDAPHGPAGTALEPFAFFLIFSPVRGEGDDGM
jgi:hypothetical protein